MLADTFDGDDGDTLRGDESGCSVFIERVVNWVLGVTLDDDGGVTLGEHEVAALVLLVGVADASPGASK